MKKKMFYLLACFAIVAAASCTKEIVDETQTGTTVDEVELVPMTVTAVSDHTRTTISADNQTVKWSETDKIAVFDGTGTREFSIQSIDETGTIASFTGEIAKDATDFVAVYPYSAAKSCADGVVVATLDAERQLSGASVADGTIVSVAKFNREGKDNLTFLNAVGFVRVDIEESDTDVVQIMIEGNNLAGTASINAEDASIAGVSEGAGTVKLSPADGSETFAPGSYFLTVLPGTTEAGNFKVTLVCQEGFSAERTATAEVKIPRNKGFYLSSSSLDKKFIIRDATTLQNFLTKAKDFTASQKAVIINDIDLEGVTLTSATSFKGTLDGGGHSLKNWTCDGVALFNKLDKGGVVKNIVFDASCKVTPAKQFGLVAVTTMDESLVSGCVNNADIVLNDETLADFRIASLVGVAYGSVWNCTNKGKVEVKISGNATGKSYIGGLVGYSNLQTQITNGGSDLCFDECYNYGDVIHTVKGTAGYLNMGGVAGGTSHNPINGDAEKDIIGAEEVNKGNARRCGNKGNVIYTFYNGGTLENGNAGSANYHNVGGVFGYWEGSLENCNNGIDGNATAAAVKIISPTMETDATSTRPSIGGVAGFVLRNMTSCNNYGPVSYIGCPQTGGLTNAGCGVEGGASAGGVVGQMGPASNGDKYSISDCHNYGKLDFQMWMGSGKSAWMYQGGVIGFSKVKISGCSNEGPMTVMCKAFVNHTGGVVAMANFDVVNSSNSGELNFTYKRTTSDSKQLNGTNSQGNAVLGSSPLAGIGGVIGRAKAAVKGCRNTGNMTVTLESGTDNIPGQNAFGGVAGFATGVNESCENEGTVNVTLPRISGQFFVGGVLGTSNTTTRTHTNLINKGKITLTNSTACGESFNYLGGSTGCNGTNQTFSGCENYGDISYDGLSKIRIGGISPYMNQTANNSVVKCNITASCKNMAYSEVGGVIGYTAAAALTNWTFEGTIDTSGSTAKVYTGGLLGKSNGASAFNGCSFKGSLTGATGNNVPGLYVGGLQTNSLAMTFGATSKCTVGAGSTINGTAVTELTLKNLVSQSSDGETYTSTATLKNIVIE